ncbi:MAG TPA: hypothetical protein VEU47_18665 [Candidatus Cybelea sp.]|nr:hypothetical protein [Candidatus Cybelea sp.]
MHMPRHIPWQDRNDLVGNVFRFIGAELLKQDTYATIEFDFRQRESLLSGLEGWIDRGQPIFDPDCNTLDKRNAFWVVGRELHGGGIVCCNSVRIYSDARLADLFIDNRLIYDGTKPPGPHNVTLRMHEADHVFGNLAYIGGGWVRPDFRGRHIPALLMALSQAIILQDYSADYSFGFVHHHDAERGLPIRSYHFHHTHRGVAWQWPGRGQLDLWLLYNTYEDIREELGLFLPLAA